MANASSSFGRLIRELRRRRVFRTAVLYIVSTWLVLQVADVIFPALNISEQGIRYVLIGAAMGFPAVLVFGWFYDIGAHGIRRTSPAGPEELIEPQPLRRFDYLLLTALAAVIAAILYNVAYRVAEEPTQIREVSTPATREGPPMVAVLPFTTTSTEGDNEFFATGIHDDLLTQLAQLQSIRVISRTSVMEYKDTVHNIREIGRALGADAILEGGIQRSGNRIRINAQLIDALTDEHLWAQTFDRELTATSIFEVQTEIAREITAAMHATLTEQDDQLLSTIPTENMAAYRAYRLAMADRGKHDLTQTERTELLKEAVELDPMFARAWAELVGSYSLQGFSEEGDPVRLAEEALEQIRLIANGSAEYLIAQSYYVYYVLKDYDQAHDLLNRAMSKSPSDVNLLELRSWIERRQGNFVAREESIRSMVKLDPRNSRSRSVLATHLIQTHQYDAAVEEIRNLESADPYLLIMSEVIQLKHDHDYKPLLDRTKIQVEGQEESLWSLLWFMYLVNHQYSDAALLLERVGQTAERFKYTLNNWESSAIWTYWLMDDQSKLQELLPDARSYMESLRQDDGSFTHSASYLSLGLVAAAEGNSAEALRLIRGWQELVRDDWAGKMTQRDRACPVLAMAGATVVAVNCIRLGLEEPSYIMPFVDPYLPFYESIRDEPEFIELLAEIELEWGL